jgi:hypothetical protein
MFKTDNDGGMRAMKLGHAAALAVAGWYLMLAPMQADTDIRCSPEWWQKFEMICDYKVTVPDNAAPFSKWLQVGTFETLSDCRAQKLRQRTKQDRQFDERVAKAIMNRAREAGQPLGKGYVDEFVTGQDLRSSVCLASDDPRLK